MNDQLFLLANQKKKTNHVLHLILSICTGGLWIIVWGLVSSSNNRHNNAIDKKMNSIVEHKVASETDSEVHESAPSGDEYKLKVMLVVVAVIILIVYLKSR